MHVHPQYIKYPGPRGRTASGGKANAASRPRSTPKDMITWGLPPPSSAQHTELGTMPASAFAHLPFPYPRARWAAARRSSAAAAAGCDGDGGGSCRRVLRRGARFPLLSPRPSPTSLLGSAGFGAAVGGPASAEVQTTGRVRAAGPAPRRPGPYLPSAPGTGGGRSAGEQAAKRGRICSLFAQSRRLNGGEATRR